MHLRSMAAPCDEFLLQRQGGLVCLERVGDDWWLYNRLTCERVCVGSGGGALCLGFDEDGEAFVYAESGAGEPKMSSELLHDTIYTSGAGRQLVVTTTVDGQVRRFLDHLLCEHVIAHIGLVFGDVMKQVDLRVAIFALPLAGCKLLWDISSAFRVLGLGHDRADDHAGKWVADTWAVWLKMARSLGLEAAMLKSAPYARKETPALSTSAERRVLPWPSVATSMLLAMMVRWAACSPARGGLKNEKSRAVCSSFVHAILASLADGPLSIRIFVDNAVVRDWPAAPRGHAPAIIDVCTDNSVEVDQLVSVCEASGDASWNKVCAAMETNMSLAQLVQLSATHHPQCGLFKQLVWAIGERIDDRLIACKGSGVSTMGSLTWREVSSEGLSDYQMDRALMRYIVGVQEVVGPVPRRLSCAPDKSRVHSMALLNTAFVLPTNQAFWGVPQVSMGCWGGVQKRRLKSPRYDLVR